MQSGERRFIRVVGAVLVEGDRLLIVRRPPEDTGAGFWEFPGGKIEEGEEPEEALHREIREELGIEIHILTDLGRHLHHYDTTDVDLQIYLCRRKSGVLAVHEHDASKWVLPTDMDEASLLAADRPFVERILQNWPGKLPAASASASSQDLAASFDLISLGWSEFFEKQLATKKDRLRLGRVAALDSSSMSVVGAFGRRTSVLKGSLRKKGPAREEVPTVGDWVMVRDVKEDPLTIEARLDRKTLLVRKSPRGDNQALAANVDRVFLVTSPNEDFSLRRMERYLAMTYSAGAEPVLILSKVDTNPDSAKFHQELAERFPEVGLISISVRTGEGMLKLRSLLPAGITGVFLGSSGVGKSSLVNALMGKDVQKTSGIREEDAKGRHTTVSRDLFELPDGGLVIDNPGIRELQLSDAEEGVDTLFADIVEIALRCKFTNCRHQNEPACAIRAALADGTIDPERWESYQTLFASAGKKSKRRNN